MKYFDAITSQRQPCASLSEVYEYVFEVISELHDDPQLLWENAPPSWAPAVVAGPYSWWFRGAKSPSADAIRSGIFRKKLSEYRFPQGVSDYGELDRKLRHEYFVLTRKGFEETTRNVWDRVFEMQHYGMRTRLLD